MEEALSRWAQAGARLMSAVRRPDGFDVLCEEMGRLVRFQNFIVYVFREGGSPGLIQTNLGLAWLQRQMSAYIDGLYTLDPFHRLTLERASGLFRMSEIMPEAFLESEYFNYFYRFTTVVDELRFIAHPDETTAIHVFMEREGDAPAFTDAEVHRARAVEPFVREFIIAHGLWIDETGGGGARRDAPFDLRAAITALNAGALTAREVDTVELMLKGHSTKSLARVLGIDDGTAANHKRNIYAKLEVHSQAQLFDLFLRSLTAP
jgi:DNA-binding CsgD family transcriptional regulator